MIEIFKFLSAKRGELGDPEFVASWKKKVSKLMSKEFAGKIASRIELNRVLKKKEYGQSCPFCEDHGTTHLNIIDKEGMIVQVTSTINLEFGAKFMDEQTGIIFNNHIDDFYIPNVDSYYGLSPMTENILEANKRPFSSASPVILIRKNEVIMLGAAGGTRIPTSIIGTLIYMVLGSSIEDAIMGTRVHDQLVPDITNVEYNFPKDIRSQLERLGHKIRISEENTGFTSVQGIHMLVGEDDSKRIYAISDPRKGGESAGK